MTAEIVHLKRTLSLPAMVFYGLGTIVGAGIYVLIGEVAGLAGPWSPLSFVLAAIIAGFTGLSYAELVGRYPRSAGEAVYVSHAFAMPWLTQVVGWSVVLTGLVSAATLLNGFAGYFTHLFGGSDQVVIAGALLLMCLLACSGVKQSVSVAVVITLLELLGLLLVVAASSNSVTEAANWQRWHSELNHYSWTAIASAAFLAFYAFIGFEDMVNMAEEVNDASASLPKAIIVAIVASTAIYIVVALTAVISVDVGVLAQSRAPLATLAEQSTWLSPSLLGMISLIAIVNGAIVQLLMAPRVVYGITQSSPRWQWLARIHPKTQTPIVATVFISLCILVFALALPLAKLAQLTSTIILCLFILVNAALIVIKKRHAYSGFQVNIIVPIFGVVTSLLLLLAQFFIR